MADRQHVIDSLQQEIEAHKKANGSESLLSAAVNFAASPFLHDKDSLTTLDKLYAEARATTNSAQLAAIDAAAKKAIGADKKELAHRGELDSYGTNTLTTAALFLRGSAGIGATLGLFGLNQATVGDDSQSRVADFGLGMLKGGLMRSLYGKLGATNLNFAFKGMALGAGTRALDVGLSRQSFESNDGRFSLSQGLKNVETSALSRDALKTDVAVFGAAGAVGGLLSRGMGERLAQNSLVQNVLSGTTFGAVSGGMQEYDLERKSGRSVSLTSVLEHAGLQGALSGIAAAPGGVQAAREAASAKPSIAFNEPGLGDVFGSERQFVGRLVNYVKPETSGQHGLNSLDRTPVANNIEALGQSRFFRLNPLQSAETIRNTALADQSTIAHGFLKPLQAEMADPAQDYNWRTFVGSQLVKLEIEGTLPKGSVDLSPLEVHSVPLSQQRAAHLRKSLETGLHTPGKLESLVGNGELGQVFPKVFGTYEAGGGIMGRPQHGGHDSDLGTHTLQVVDNVRSNPGFAQLSQKDQTDTLMAALFHDTGKRAGVIDPTHESNSTVIAKGILKSLGYSPERIQRITDLIPRHSEVSFDPHDMTSARFQNQHYLDSVATQYLKPTAAQQIRIMNESDIRAVKNDDALWTDNVRSELDTVHQAITNRVQEVSTNRVPVLTDALPQRFGLFGAPNKYNFFMHRGDAVSPELFKRMPLIESPHSNTTATLIDRAEAEAMAAKGTTGVFALLSAVPEHVSAASTARLGDTPEGWDGHVSAVASGNTTADAQEFARRINAQLEQLGLASQEGGFSALNNFRRQISQYDNSTELNTTEGYQSIMSRANRLVAREYTSRTAGGADGAAANEFHINAPSISGIGIVRGGKSVLFEGLSPDSALAASGVPDWVAFNGNPQDNIVIPQETWQEARRRNIPIVALD